MCASAIESSRIKKEKDKGYDYIEKRQAIFLAIHKIARHMNYVDTSLTR